MTKLDAITFAAQQSAEEDPAIIKCPTRDLRTLYVRAFLAGARWQQDEQREVLIGLHKRIVAAKHRERELELRVQHYEQDHNLPDDCCLTEFTRVETLTNSPTPSTSAQPSGTPTPRDEKSS